MTIKEALEIIQSDSVSIDILCGNSPTDMAVRAMENSDIRSVVQHLDKKSNHANVDFILMRLKMKFNSFDTENSLQALGSITAYFEVLRNFPGQEVLNLFAQTISRLAPDNFLRKILTYQLENICLRPDFALIKCR